MVATKTVLLVCVLVSCANRVHSTTKTKFSFRDTFVTPSPYEKRNAELDECEILERSNFSPDEKDDNQSSQKLKDAPIAVANTQIHMRFGGSDEHESSPIVRKEAYIELLNEHKPRNRCPYMPEYPPYMFRYPYPPIFPPPYNLYCPYDPYDLRWQRSAAHSHFYPPYSDLGYPNSLHSPKSKSNHDGLKQNIFPIVNPPLDNSNPPFVYFFKRDKDGQIPSFKDIRNQPPKQLTDEDLKLIGKYLGSGEDDYDETCSTIIESTCSTTPKPTKCYHSTTINSTPSTCSATARGISTTCGHLCNTCTKSTTKQAYTCGTSKSTSRSCSCGTKATTRRSTCSLRSTTTSHNCVTPPPPIKYQWHSTPASNPCNQTTRKVTTTFPQCPQTHTSPPFCTLPGDVVLDSVVPPARCNCSSTNHDCLTLSDKLTFIKINVDDITNSSGNCSCSKDSEFEEDKSVHDMDELVEVKGAPEICDPGEALWSPYQLNCPCPWAPYGYPRYPTFPWWFLGDNLRRPCGKLCEINSEHVSDGRFAGPPPFLQNNGLYDLRSK